MKKKLKELKDKNENTEKQMTKSRLKSTKRDKKGKELTPYR